MGFFDALNPATWVSKIIGEVKETVDEFHQSGEEKAEWDLAVKRLEASLTQQAVELQAKIHTAQLDIIKEEAKGKWYQRAWRPFLMFTFGALVWNNFMLPQYFESVIPVEVPDWLWYIFAGLAGVYIPSRSIEKSMSEWFKEKP